MRAHLFRTLWARGPRVGPGPGPLGKALALGAGAALLAGAVSAAPASAQVPRPGEGGFGAPFDQRLVPLRERRAEGEWPPAEQPWLATQALLVPPGFRATVYAKFATANVRGLALGPSGVLFVSRPQDGAIDLLLDRNQDGFAEVRDQVLNGLDCPHGLAVSGGWLYAAQMHRVERFPLSGGNGTPSGTPAPGTEPPPVTVGRQGEVLADDLPDGPCGDHGYRSIAVDPAKNAVYVGVGMLCNVCIEEGPDAEKLATVRRYPLPAPGTAGPATAATNGEPARPGAEHARGMRNVVGMAMNPWDGTLWGGNVERDEQGDDEPPEQITRIPAGGDFGWPYCYRTRDGAWRTDNRVPAREQGCADLQLTTPTVTYQAHSTPLGLAFHDGKGLPPAFGPSLFVALHGSWNHTVGVGFKVIRIPLDDAGQPEGLPQEFASGWLSGLAERVQEKAWGRPVSVAVGLDGALFVSDDKAGAVYRLAYTGR